LQTTTKLLMRLGRTLVFFTRHHRHEFRTRSVVLRARVDRRSSLRLHCARNQEWCAQNSSGPVAARRAAFFRPSGALTASARITAASFSSPVVSSLSSRRFYFSTKPNSACRIMNPTTRASGIGIGWRPNA
jgi:hypothetical protein